MDNLDIEISKKIAEESSKQMNQLRKEIESNKDVHISLLKDTLSDMRGERIFIKKISIFLCCFIICLILGIIGIGIYGQRTLKNVFNDFINGAELSTNVEMTTDNNSINLGDLNIK